MNLNIKATNITLNADTEGYLEKKLLSMKKIVDLEADNVFAQVELAKNSEHHRRGLIFRAEINLRANGHNFRAVAEEEDLHAAIDKMKDELMREVKGGKEKWLTKARKGEAKAKKNIKNDSESEG